MFDSDRTVLVVSAWSYKPGKGRVTHHEKRGRIADTHVVRRFRCEVGMVKKRKVLLLAKLQTLRTKSKKNWRATARASYTCPFLILLKEPKGTRMAYLLVNINSPMPRSIPPVALHRYDLSLAGVGMLHRHAGQMRRQ